MSNRLQHVTKQRAQRSARVRAKVVGTAERPRMSVTITNRHIGVQLIDDTAHTTVVGITTVGKKSATGTMTERAVWAGKEIAKRAKTKDISTVSFDRGSKLYHGRVKALADAAREAGLEF